MTNGPKHGLMVNNRKVEYEEEFNYLGQSEIDQRKK